MQNDQVLSPNTSGTLTFTPINVGLLSGANYAGTINLAGTENGSVTYDTLYTSAQNDSLTVQSIANLQQTALVLSDTTVSVGQSGLTLKLAITNNGQADAVIPLADSVRISYSSDYVLASQQSFPYTLAGGSSDTLQYTVKVAADAPTGNDSFTATIGYIDANSGTFYSNSNATVNLMRQKKGKRWRRNHKTLQNAPTNLSW